MDDTKETGTSKIPLFLFSQQNDLKKNESEQDEELAGKSNVTPAFSFWKPNVTERNYECSDSSKTKLEFKFDVPPTIQSEPNNESEESEYVPPKPTAVLTEEPKAIFSSKCSVFVLKGTEYEKLGIGQLHIKTDETDSTVWVNSYIDDTMKHVTVEDAKLRWITVNVFVTLAKKEDRDQVVAELQGDNTSLKLCAVHFAVHLVLTGVSFVIQSLPEIESDRTVLQLHYVTPRTFAGGIATISQIQLHQLDIVLKGNLFTVWANGCVGSNKGFCVCREDIYFCVISRQEAYIDVLPGDSDTTTFITNFVKPNKTLVGVEAQIVARKRHLEDNENSENALGNGNNFDKIAFGSAGGYDTDVYGSVRGQRKNDYLTSINAGDEEDDAEDELTAYSAPKRFVEEAARHGQGDDPFAETRTKTIAERQSNYQARARQRQISPERADMFADQTPDIRDRSYAQIMKEQMLREETDKVEKELTDKAKSGELKITKPSAPAQKRGRWDETPKIEALGAGALTPSQTPGSTQRKRLTLASNISAAAAEVATPRVARWDETPAHAAGVDATPTSGAKAWDATPSTQTPRRNRWDETPHESVRDGMTPSARDGMTPGWGAETPRDAQTPSESKRRSRWDLTPSAATPVAAAATPSSTHMAGGATPSSFTPSGAGMTPSMMTPGGTTPVGTPAMGLKTPIMPVVPMTPDQMALFKPLSDEELDALFPPGYKVLPPPNGYIPLRTPGRKLLATPTPMGAAGTPMGFMMQGTPERPGLADKGVAGLIDTQPKNAELPPLKPEDIQYFDKLLMERKSGLRKITENARRFGAGALFNQILPLLMSPTLEDQERHLMVKVIDRVLYKLDDLVRPYVHKILVVIEPLLIDEDYYARVEGREIISNLAKAAGIGLATMISTMRPDIDNVDEYVRNTTARAFAVVASALGIPALLPFLKAVCKSKRVGKQGTRVISILLLLLSLFFFLEGIKIVQQMAILMGCAVLPHLRSLVEIVETGLVDDQQKVRTITALCLAALAEAATPYGIEAFDSVLKPLWKGIRSHRGKGLAAFLKAIGFDSIDGC
ncbi:Splicing factor 3B subunit 1 [Dirofilaria immitis]|nr:Splicing factor 3B subunit 1 [Dirofilaria immitis]